MPLINLQTNLKSLSYNGNGPYVEKDINNPGRPASESVQGRVDDTTRMLRLLGDKGVAFTSKQALLLAGTKGLTAIPQAANILANIIAQVPVNGTGTHFLPISDSAYYTGVTNASSRALQGGAIGAPSGEPFTRPSRVVDRTSAYQRASYTPVLGENTVQIPGFANSTITITTFKGSGSLDTRYGFAAATKPDIVGLSDINQDTASDLVPIKFTLYNGTDITATLLFRGFIESLSDDMSGNWDSIRYIGRAEELYSYSGFSRGINLNFQIPVFSSQEQTPVLNKVNALKSAVLPKYKNNLPVATFCKLRIGDLIGDDTTYAVLTGVNQTIENDVPWSIGSDNLLLPQLHKLSVSMKVLHKDIPQVWNSELGRQFIGHTVS
jgi:hypothetical protein